MRYITHLLSYSIHVSNYQIYMRLGILRLGYSEGCTNMSRIFKSTCQVLRVEISMLLRRSTNESITQALKLYCSKLNYFCHMNSNCVLLLPHIDGQVMKTTV